MELFEGYVGIRLGDGQVVDDVLFSLLLVLFICFALVFRSNYPLFMKMLRDVVFLKERQNLSRKNAGNEWFFRHFMTFQALFLCSIGLFAIGRAYGYVDSLKENTLFLSIFFLFLLLWVFYYAKQGLYFLFGSVFAERAKYRFWKTSYNAIIGAWGVLLYLPVLWLVFVGASLTVPVVLFGIFYILCRFVIIYKTIRIFHKKNREILYISLYLCGQEILPLVFLYKGIVYLYNFIEASTLWH